MSDPKPIGSVNIELLARIGDAEPQSIGWMQVPLTASHATQRLEGAFKDAVDYVREDFRAIFGRGVS